jgi:uracil-DNA glycosylase
MDRRSGTSATPRAAAKRKTPDWSAEPFVPERHRLDVLAGAAKGCEGCPLYRDATQVVFGEGKETASMVLIGEQPGDQEDRQGRPFVGPAGGVLERALAAAGLTRDRLYLTNAVKHFKFEPRGKRRLHQKPRWSEIKACRPWLEAELDAIAPRVIVTLGATAGQALLGAGFKLGEMRGRPLSTRGSTLVIATFHPSAVLRAEAHGGGEPLFELIVQDLRMARSLVQSRTG